MIAADVVQELFALTIALLIVRYLQGKLNPDSTWGKAIAYIYH